MKRILLLFITTLLCACSTDFAPYDNEFYYYNADKPEYIFRTPQLYCDDLKDQQVLINGDYINISMDYLENGVEVTFATEKPFDILYFGGYRPDNSSEELGWDREGYKYPYHYVSKLIPYSKLREPECGNDYYYFMLSQKRH